MWWKRGVVYEIHPRSFQDTDGPSWSSATRPRCRTARGRTGCSATTVLAAFGVSRAAAPEPFRIALAALDLLADAAADTPLLLLADDLQWIDRPTLDVLAFVARRLESDPIVLLAAARDGGEALEDSGLPELRLGALEDEAAEALLDRWAPGLGPALRERLLAAAAGNPLALEELPLAANRLGEEAAPGEWLPLTERLERAFAERASELPEATRALLLVAAEDDGGVLAEVLAAAGALAGLERPITALEPALAAGLATLDGDALRFRHPLVRSALHQAAELAERLAAHAALAGVLRDQPDRRAWHLAALAALGAGRHADAFAHLRRIYDPADLAFHTHLRTWAVGELAEAAAHSGNEHHALIAVRELERVADRAPAPMLLAGLAGARAHLAGDEHAEAHYLAGLGGELASYPRQRAALLLAYGAWLRRRRRVAESRAPLRAARDTFDALGILPWGQRARQELRASGEASGRRAPEARDELTPQELQIAQMAAQGLSNREIGQTLHLSHRTVSSHLYRLFPKLGISSRAELRDALAARA